MDHEDSSDLTRRTMFRGAALGVVALPVLAACGGSNDTQSGGGKGASGDVLAKTTDIQVGGAVFLDTGIVITEPTAGEFHAFDRTCTHQQCLVTDIQDGKIHCNCHQSLYDMSTGKNVGGPAPSPLTKIDILVKGGKIIRA
jgi:Rieske Fe-S protein